MAIEQLALSKLRIDGGTQQRAKINLEVVEEYAERFAELPKPIVFFDGAEYWLAGGFHRYHAAAKLERKKVECEVRKGTQRDAILFSCGDNSAHGLRRSNADKRKAVLTLLQDDEWGQKSDRWIAEVCNVSPTFVGELRAENELSKSKSTVNVDSSLGTLGKDGKRRTGKLSAEEKAKRAAAKAAEKKAKADKLAAERAKKKAAKEAEAAVKRDAKEAEQKRKAEEKALAAIRDAEEQEEAEATAEEKCAADNKAIESFCQSLVKFFNDNAPQTAWTDRDGRIPSALSSIRAGCNTLRTAKAVVCPSCDGEGCQYCSDEGYLPKFKADQVSRAS